MIFDILKYGTFTADDFLYAHTNNDFSKFTLLPVDLRKQFISGVIDLYSNKENKNFKQTVFDYIDKKTDLKQFSDIWWKYWVTGKGAAAAVVVTVVSAMAGAAGAEVTATAVAASAGSASDYYLPHFKHHASLLNKLIQEYE